jgi:major membrane immunogen (membrane-anchored lipoprotein)
MIRNRVVRFSALFLALALALPAVSSLAQARESKGNVKTEITIANNVWLGGKELKPGQYNFVADGSKVTVTLDGKKVVEAPIQWQDGKGKFNSSAVVIEGHEVKEIRFGGQTRAAVVQPNADVAEK